MPFDKEEVQQLESMFERQHSAIMLDMRTLLQQELRPIRSELEQVKLRLEQLFKMETGDIQIAYKEIRDLKNKIKKLEQRIAALEH